MNALHLMKNNEHKASVNEEHFLHCTERTDWEMLAEQLYREVIEGCPFGLAVVTKNPLVSRKRLILRTNDGFDPKAAIYFLRDHFRVAHYDAILNATEDPVRHGRYDLHKVQNPWLGLPIHSLVYVIKHVQNPTLSIMLIFGGERVKGQLEHMLQATEKIISSPSQTPHEPSKQGPDTSLMLDILRNLEPREFGSLDIHSLSGIVHGLAGVINHAPSALRSKYALLNDLLLELTKE